VPKTIVEVNIVIPIGPVNANEGIRNAKPNLVIFKAPLVKIGANKFLNFLSVFFLFIIIGNIKFYYLNATDLFSDLYSYYKGFKTSLQYFL
jgi:hypothetical protein